ncbi:recombination protein NinB, partial [Salmonella enterica subsp. enterica serovar Anatum]|nr:recombination protein NinB [Salmonella enterica subsp. enterica serovar Anatum]
RYYEQIGLIPAASRTDSGYRAYTQADVNQLHFIRRARDLGFSEQDVVPNLAGNGFVVIGQSTSRMRVSEFAELLELIQAFGTERG